MLHDGIGQFPRTEAHTTLADPLKQNGIIIFIFGSINFLKYQVLLCGLLYNFPT